MEGPDPLLRTRLPPHHRGGGSALGRTKCKRRCCQLGPGLLHSSLAPSSSSCSRRSSQVPASASSSSSSAAAPPIKGLILSRFPIPCFWIWVHLTGGTNRTRQGTYAAIRRFHIYLSLQTGFMQSQLGRCCFLHSWWGRTSPEGFRAWPGQQEVPLFSSANASQQCLKATWDRPRSAPAASSCRIKPSPSGP